MGNVNIAIAVLNTARDVRFSANKTLTVLNICDVSEFSLVVNTFLPK
jgi:hypothetical protein